MPGYGMACDAEQQVLELAEGIKYYFFVYFKPP